VGLRAVIFDLGGVVLGSPLHAIRDYERAAGLPEGGINRVVADTGAAGAWSRLERGLLAMDAFYEAFEEDCRRAGLRVCARTLMARIGDSAPPRPLMLDAIGRIRDRGLAVGALTNNWVGDGGERTIGADSLRPHFDAFVESAVEGVQKPDPRIYHLTCERLGVAPPESAFLDDIGRNLKAARALGMTTIKVEEPESALDALAEALGFPLR